MRSYHLESLQARLKDIEELLERYYENGEYLGSSSFEIVKGKIEKGFLPTYLELENLEKELGFPVVERAIRIRKGNELFDKLYSVAEISELTKEMFPSNEITLEVLHPEQFIRSLFLIGLEVCLYFISSYDRKVTIGEISDKLGVNPRTVLNVTSILRDYGLIERKRGEYYPARSLYSFGLEIISLMKRRVEWLKKYIGAQEMYKKGENIGKISRELNIHQYTVYNWVKMGDKPRRVSLTTLYNLKRFGQIEDEDIEKLKNHGLVR